MRTLLAFSCVGAALWAAGCILFEEYHFDQYRDEATSTGAPTGMAEGPGGASSGETSTGETSTGETSTSASTGLGDDTLELLYADQPPGITSLAAYDSYLYWGGGVPEQPKSGFVIRGNKDGGTGNLKSFEQDAAQVKGIAVDSGIVYWFELDTSVDGNDQGRLYSQPNDGGAKNDVLKLSQKPFPVIKGFALRGLQIYMTLQELTSAQFIARIDKSGENLNKYISNRHPIGPVVADDASVYWLDDEGLMRSGLTSATTQNTLKNPAKSPMSMALGDQDIYWTQADGLLCSVKKTAKDVSPDCPKISDAALKSVSVDAKGLYVNTAHQVLKVSLDSAPTMTPLVTTPHTITAMFVDGAFVYFAAEDTAVNKASIYRVPK